MLIKTEISERIINFLENDLYINLNILGILENVGNIEVFVDDIVNPKGIYINKGYFNYIYTREDSFINEVCATFKDNGFYGFSGIESSIAKKIKEKFLVTWENPCVLYYMPKENLNLDLIKNKVSNIVIDDAVTVDNFYEFRHDESLNDIKDDIKNRPSSCVYKDDELISWCLVHDDNSMGIMYTKEEERRKGYAVDVTIDLASKILNKGKIPFMQIINRNNLSPGLGKKSGFVECGLVNWFGIVKGIPEELHELNDEIYDQIFSVIPKLKQYFLIDNSYCTMHMFLSKLKVIESNIIEFEFIEVKTLKLLEIWCDITSSEYDIEKEYFKSIIKNEFEREKTSLRMFVGNINGVSIGTSALWTHGKDSEIASIFCLSVLEDYQDRGIESIMINSTIDISKIAGADLFFTRINKNKSKYYNKVGFDITKEFEIDIK